MNVMWFIAGVLGMSAALIHGFGGEKLIFAQLDTMSLPTTRFGGARASRRLLRTSWHLVTAAFAVLAGSLFVASVMESTQATRGAMQIVGACSTAFALVVTTVAMSRGPRGLLRHPAPAILTAIAVLTWWGAS